MYASGWSFVFPQTGARYRQDELRSRDFMLLRMRQEGGILDEGLERPAGDRESEWTRLRIVLSGRVHERGGGATLGERTIYGTPDHRTERSRPLTRSSDWLDVYWRHDSSIGGRLGSELVLRLSPEETGRIDQLTSALERRDLTAAQHRATELLAALRAAGVPLEPEALTQASDEAARDFAEVLWQLAGRLSDQPMALDLSRALGVGERQALRRARAHIERFHVTASGWREFLGRLRVELGVFFISSPGARTEDVSRFLGFASPTGFCHALQDAGLPSPIAVQRELCCS